MRLDVFLTERGMARSRTEAKRLIDEGHVFVGDTLVTKASYEISRNLADNNDKIGQTVRVERTDDDFVSRGGIKLRAALDGFGIDVSGKKCIDVGASSGGFTDCLLQRGAEHVIAVDSGVGQLAEKLRRDSRVTSVEKYNARYMNAEDLEYAPQLAVMDVSFISVTHILPSLFSVLADSAELVCLIKPQFEVGRAYIGKGGIVKDERARERAVCEVISFAEGCGFKPEWRMLSPIKGGDGNTEFLAYFTKGDKTTDEEKNKERAHCAKYQ